MARVIGSADEFYRLRLTRVDTTEGLDFEWHDDILYRAPRVQQADEVEHWHVEAVRTDDPDTVLRLGTFADAGQARTLLSAATDDLAEMTKAEFERAYLADAEPGDVGTE